MEEITINGISSRTIKGLMILSLPPITKPKQRVKKTEIDGRDGDLVTLNGYAAYDRKFKIAITDDRRTNEVVQFFNANGTAIFSNEPGMAYEFETLDALQFKRVKTVREAEVVLHCQPFKYDATSPVKQGANGATVTNEGNILARPYMTFNCGTTGGTLNLYIDEVQLLTIDMTANYMRLDAEKMEAYLGATEILGNRRVTGDISKVQLTPGTHTIRAEVDGKTVDFRISRYSRWV